eukprot:2955400-Heterocapsa_arctica.AAC.1
MLTPSPASAATAMCSRARAGGGSRHLDLALMLTSSPASAATAMCSRTQAGERAPGPGAHAHIIARKRCYRDVLSNAAREAGTWTWRSCSHPRPHGLPPRCALKELLVLPVSVLTKSCWSARERLQEELLV